MAQKTKIQYVNPGYIYGSVITDPGPGPKKNVPKPTEPAPVKSRSIYVDPLALGGLAVAICMLVFLVTGAYHLKNTRVQYDEVKTVLSDARRQNASLSHTYHTSYDLEEIREAAEKIGMVDAEETDCFTVFFSLPEEKKEPTAWENFKWFVSLLFSEPKRPE